MMDFFESRTVVIILCMTMLVAAIVFRLKSRSWSNPSVVFALFWFGMTLLPVLAVPQIEASPRAIGYILSAIVAFGLPVFFWNWVPLVATAKARAGQVNPILSSNYFLLLFILVELIIFATIALNVKVQGFPISTLLSDPFKVGCEFLMLRYRGEVISNVYSQLATVLNYVAAPIAGLMVANRKSFVVSAVIVFICLVPSIMSMVLYGDKGTVFLSMALFYGSVVVGRIQNGNVALLTWRSVASAPLLLVFIAAFIALALINRESATCEDRTVAVVQALGSNIEAPQNDYGGGSRFGINIRSYAFAHIFAFSDWFDHWLSGEAFSSNIVVLPKNSYTLPTKMTQQDQTYTNPSSIKYGFWTFMAVGKMVDKEYYNSLPLGYYGEYYRKPGILQTNIYTFFRGFIYDFTIVGSLVLMLAFGLFMNFMYKNMLIGSKYAYSQVAYIYFAGCLYTSYIISLLIWTSVYASAILLVVLMIFINYFEMLDKLSTVARFLPSGWLTTKGGRS
jgi:hypothetical protein